MDRWKKRPLVFIMVPVFLLTLTAAPAFAQEEGDSAEMLYILLDFAIARPAGLAVTAFGTAFFIATLPVSAALQGHEKMLRVFVLEPGEFTFLRPLGEF
ncbi:MAG: hypothetical protein GY849_07270 [Deltaproteobacteria bacterium]|nr:hypothetical protein [Deltaproteobacteria bacterium]